jgi:hypothetical protein
MKNRTFILQKLYGMALATLLFGTLSAKAAIYTWTNPAGGNWSAAANWSPNQVPGSSDTANITMAGTYAVALDVNTNVNNLTIGGAGSGVQTLLADNFDLDATNALINSDGILSMSNSIFTGTLVVTSGGVFSMNNNVTVDAQVTVENGGELQLLTDDGYSSIGDESAADTNSWLWLQGGAQMSAVSGFRLYLFAPMTNSGTCSFTNVVISMYSDYGGGLANLAGGVINLISGNNGSGIYGENGFEYVLNEGTINVTNGTSEIDLGLGLLTGTYNAAAGVTVFFTDDSAAGTSAGAGLTLDGSGQYQFYSGLLTLASNTIPNLQYVGGTLVLGSNFQGGAITNLTLAGITLSNTLPVTGTFSVANSYLFGSYLVTSGAVFNVNNGGGIGVTMDGQVTVENGGEMLLSGGGNGIYFSDSDYAHSNNWLWLQSGGQMIGDSGFVFNLGSHMTNSGTCSLTNGFIDNGNGGLVNLPGGVINLISGTSIYGYSGFDYLMNEGTINVTDGTSEIGVGLGLLTGTYNAAAGATVQFVTDSAAGTSPGPGLTLGGSGQYQFYSGLLTVASYPIPNLMIDVGPGTFNAGATLALAADFQGGAITNLALDGITLSNTLPVTGTFSVTNGALLGSYLMTSGAVLSANNSALYGSYVVPNGAVLAVDGVSVYAQVTVENAGELQLLTNAGASSIGGGGFGNANYWLWLQGGGQMTAPSGFELDLWSPMTNSGTCALTNGNIFIHNDNSYAIGGLVNLAGGVINLTSGASIDSSSLNGEGFDYLVNEGEIDVFSAGTNSTISVDFVTNAATLSAQHGTLELQSTNLILEPSGTLSVGLNSATDFGSIAYSNTADLNLAQAGTFQVALNGGYVPAAGSSFTVLLANSSGIFSGAFANFSSPDGAIWQTNYTATSLIISNVGQMAWATTANITYGTAVNASQLNASTTPNLAGTFAYNPVAGTVLNSGAGQLLTATFTPSDPSYAPALFQVPITVLQAPLSVTATNQTKTYGQTFTFAGTEFVTSGLVNDDTVTRASISSAGSPPTAPVIDSPYTITINNAVGDAGLTNYVITYTTGKLTVNPAPLGITADSTSKTYGQTITFAGSEFVFTPLSNSETIGTVTLTSAGAISNAPVSGSPYSIVPSAATGGTFTPGNYAINYTNGALTVNRAGLTVTANPALRDYGAAIPAFSATYSGFVNNETVSVVSGTPGFSTPATPTSPVDSYMITPSLGSLTASNYTFRPFVNGTLTVSQEPLTVTAGAQSKTYGQTVVFGAGGTNFASSGLQNSETIGTVTLAVSGNAGAATAPVSGSPYTITPSAASGGTFSTANYAITYDTNHLTVNQAALTVMASAQSKTYGQTVAFGSGNTNFTSSTLQNGETIGSVTLTVSTNGGAASAPVSGSPYRITPSLAIGGSFSTNNYAITYDPGNLTVNTAPLTVTAKSRSKTYGQLVTFAGTEFTTSELLNSDTVTSVTLTSPGAAANATVAGSPYNILPIAAVGNGVGNYTIIYDDGFLTVTLPFLNVVASPPNMILSWTTNASAFVLNRTASLSLPVTWTPMTSGINVNGTSNTITINTSSGNQFYALIAP